MNRNRLLRPFAIAALACLLAASAIAQTRPLKILLTNDDGFDSNGLKVMRAALVAAGHQVTVVAPATNMSSTGMSMTSGSLKVENRGDGVWAVHGTPADAAQIGLAHLLRETPQDLVISGTNAGQNLGSSTNASGTVNAALVAARYGVPAIATSAGIGGDAAHAYAVAAAIVNRMIPALDATRPAGGKLLPDGLVINVNVPVGTLAGLKWAPLSRRGAFARVYTPGDQPDELRSRLTLTPPGAADPDSDLALFNQGYVTLTLLDGDMGMAASPAASAITARLSKLAIPGRE